MFYFQNGARSRDIKERQMRNYTTLTETIIHETLIGNTALHKHVKNKQNRIINATKNNITLKKNTQNLLGIRTRILGCCQRKK